MGLWIRCGRRFDDEGCALHEQGSTTRRQLRASGSEQQVLQDKTGVYARRLHRPAHLCYWQVTASGDRARIDAHNGATLMVLWAITCAATFVLVHGGWTLRAAAIEEHSSANEHVAHDGRRRLMMVKFIQELSGTQASSISEFRDKRVREIKE
jgi:hypothetical protein